MEWVVKTRDPKNLDRANEAASDGRDWFCQESYQRRRRGGCSPEGNKYPREKERKEASQRNQYSEAKKIEFGKSESSGTPGDLGSGYSSLPDNSVQGD